MQEMKSWNHQLLFNLSWKYVLSSNNGVLSPDASVANVSVSSLFLTDCQQQMHAGLVVVHTVSM